MSERGERRIAAGRKAESESVLHQRACMLRLHVLASRLLCMVFTARPLPCAATRTTPLAAAVAAHSASRAAAAAFGPCGRGRATHSRDEPSDCQPPDGRPYSRTRRCSTPDRRTPSQPLDGEAASSNRWNEQSACRTAACLYVFVCFTHRS